jgi:hypothetical protein
LWIPRGVVEDGMGFNQLEEVEKTWPFHLKKLEEA